MDAREIKKHRALSTLLAGSTALTMAVASGCNRASTTDPNPSSGGQTYVLDYDVFASSIDSLLSAYGCDNAACHGGGARGTFELSPSGNKDIAFDFAQARLQVNGHDPVSSPLIMKPLAPECGGPGHAGGFVFTELDNPDYLAILAWIEAGEFR